MADFKRSCGDAEEVICRCLSKAMKAFTHTSINVDNRIENGEYLQDIEPDSHCPSFAARNIKILKGSSNNAMKELLKTSKFVTV